MPSWLYLMFAGGAGTLARFSLGRYVSSVWGDGFPWGTLVVNSVGSFLFGLVWVLADELGMLDEQVRGLVLIGFMGAFTTFSTFAFDTGQMLLGAEWGRASLNLLLQNGVGITCLIAGIGCARLFA